MGFHSIPLAPMSNDATKSTSYADAGVSIDRGNELVEKIKPAVMQTLRPEVMGNIGGFGALFDISSLYYKNPVLVSGTDGIGTKINLAIQASSYECIGIDLVAMCVNDLLVQGAEPLFFLDYYATSKLETDVAVEVVKSIAEGCQIAGCALIGGETAEMPGMYKAGDFDLAGFCVGIVEKDEIIDGSKTSEGDTIIGLASSGPHSNGYSLIRKILADSEIKISDQFEKGTYADVLLSPTRIYIKSVLKLLQDIPVKAISHITGGGLLENIPRALPGHLQANIDSASWKWQAIFNWLMETGNIKPDEMYRTFNCGVGMVLIVDSSNADMTIEILNKEGEQAWKLGELVKGQDSESRVNIY